MTVRIERSFSAHLPQWQLFSTQLMAPSHQVAAIAAKDKQPEVHPYQRQYAHVYHQRYQQLAPLCWKAVEKQIPVDEAPRIKRILELPDEGFAVVVGTLVQEAVPDDDSKPLAVGTDCKASDSLFLEDDSGRVALEYGNQKHAWPTGAVLAVYGKVEDGVLQVQQIIPPLAPEVQRDVVMSDSTNSNSDHKQPCYLLLLSGLECGNPAIPPTARDMLLSFLQGRLGHPAAPRVARVLIAGGWASSSSGALRDADAWLDQILATGLPCDILPGQDDPTTANWPQRPLHRALLPRSSLWNGTCYRTPNPYRAQYAESTVVVATDGLNVRAQQGVTCVLTHHDDSSKGWKAPSVLDVMQQHLDCRHLCPVGPSHVPTAPHAEQDPMVLAADDDDNSTWPHLYVTGGHDAFGTTTTPQGTRLVAVPSFGRTGTAVLVDLHSPQLNVQLLQFVDETE